MVYVRVLSEIPAIIMVQDWVDSDNIDLIMA